jgi:hypothetical protein
LICLPVHAGAIRQIGPKLELSRDYVTEEVGTKSAPS